VAAQDGGIFVINRRYLENDVFSMMSSVPEEHLKSIESPQVKARPADYLLYPPNNCSPWEVDWWSEPRWDLCYNNLFINTARWRELILTFPRPASTCESRLGSASTDDDVFLPSGDGPTQAPIGRELRRRMSTISETPLYSCDISAPQHGGGFAELERCLGQAGLLLNGVKALYRSSITKAFESRIGKLSLDDAGGWLAEKARVQADADCKRAMAEDLVSKAFACRDGVRVVLAWHGCRSEENALQMFRKGMLKYNVRDSGFFGAGIYLTLDPVYAAMYAAGCFDREQAASTNNGPFTMVLCAVAVSRVYPITQQSDYNNGTAARCVYAGSQLEMRAVHMARVSAESGWQATDTQQPPSGFAPVELVVSEEDDVLPLYMVSFSREIDIDDVL
jgi:hypothetical protein